MQSKGLQSIDLISLSVSKGEFIAAWRDSTGIWNNRIPTNYFLTGPDGVWTQTQSSWSRVESINFEIYSESATVKNEHRLDDFWFPKSRQFIKLDRSRQLTIFRSTDRGPTVIIIGSRRVAINRS